MRIALFFAYLCLLLLSRTDSAHASAHAGIFRYTQLQSAPVSHSEIAKDRTANGIPDYFICDSAEDDDEDGPCSRKLKLASCHSALSALSVLSYYHNLSKTPQPFNGQASYKYILQRVIRV